MSSKKCTAIFTTTKSFNPVSFIVRIITGEKYSHCAWLTEIPDIPEIPLVYHASKFNVHFIPYSEFIKHNKIVYEFEFELDREEYLDILKLCLQSLGKPYDTIGLVLNPLFKLFKIKNKNPICSELLIKILKNKIEFYGEVENIVPEEVKEAIQRYKGL